MSNIEENGSGLKDRFNAYMELVRYAAGRHDARRQIEWKVNFAFWTLLVGGAWALRSTGRPVPPILLHPLFPYVVLGLYAFVWLRGLWRANADDKNMADYFRDLAQRLLGEPASQHKTRLNPIAWYEIAAGLGFLKDWAMQSHIMMTWVMLVVFRSLLG